MSESIRSFAGDPPRHPAAHAPAPQRVRVARDPDQLPTVTKASGFFNREGREERKGSPTARERNLRAICALERSGR